MKIRIKGNALRYRLTKSDLAKLWSEGLVEEQTAFAGGPFIYSIETVDQDQLSVDFIGGRIFLRMPRPMVEELFQTERVGFEGLDGRLQLLIEKDFACIDRTEEDQSDNYPNPRIICD
jgi:Family of unknown function (DUF7009)